MRTTLTLILTMLATFCQGECPIECFCGRVTSCTGDKLLDHFPTFDVNPFPFRIELQNYNVRSFGSQDYFHSFGRNLTELSMARNMLERVDNETFSYDEEVLELRILDLSQNKLSYFVGGAKLKKLRILDISSNRLQQVYELPHSEVLESVNLRDNLISYLPPTSFKGLKHLQYINLDSNRLEWVDPGTFSNLNSLAHLILSSNPISNIVSGGFYWNSRVQFVDVSNVGLSKIPTSLTKTVRDFRCANNNLTVIRQTDFESYPNVGLLVLDDNVITTVEDDAFGRLEYLTRLWMNGNRLSRIPQNLPPSLQSLHLEDNRIQNLSASDFKNLRNVQELNLHGNRISALPPYVFAELISLRNLDIRSNNIDVIYGDSFANLSHLETLDLSQNPIKVVVTGAFGPLQKLSLLHLTRILEQVEVDPLAFVPLGHCLTILELNDSPHFAQKLILDNALQHLQKLVELNLQRCEFEDLNILSNAIVELPLRTLKLNGNPWNCQDLSGSSTHDLISAGSIIDHPVCSEPKELRGVLLSSLNLSLTTASVLDEELTVEDDEEDNEQQQLGMDIVRQLSRESDSDNPPDSLTNSEEEVAAASGTNSPGNGPHADNPNVNLRSEQSASDSDNSGRENAQSSSREEESLATRTTAAVELDTAPPPTISYFAGNSNSSSNNNNGDKKNWRSAEHATKTNDDNTIIDGRGRYLADVGRGPARKSIDGFPSSRVSRPKAFYLRGDTTQSTSGAIILKTIIISALACLISVLTLLSIGYGIYRITRYSSSRKTFCIHGRRKSDDNEESCGPSSTMSYRRFDRNPDQEPVYGSSYRRNESDHVELSGISNRLYLEAEEIYHIS